MMDGAAQFEIGDAVQLLDEKVGGKIVYAEKYPSGTCYLVAFEEFDGRERCEWRQQSELAPNGVPFQ